MLSDGKLVVWVLALFLPATLLFNVLVPNPYMDEIFHVPQVQQYCKGNFASWDPKITTLPGLYYLSLPCVGILYAVVSIYDHRLTFQDVCSTPILRFLNVILAVKCIFLFREIAFTVNPKSGIQEGEFKALVLAAFPLQWFFSFMYYTDIASTAAVMTMYLMVLRKRQWLAAVFSVEAILIRQTNAVWVVFTLCVAVITLLSQPPNQWLRGQEERGSEESLTEGKKIADDVQLTKLRSADYEGILRKRVGGHAKDIRSPQGEQPDSKMKWKQRREEPDIIKALAMLVTDMWNRSGEVLWSIAPLLVVLMGCAAFFIWNGGIVVGAKEAHQVSLHLAQILYFGAFSVFMLAPVHLSKEHIQVLLKKAIQGMRKPSKVGIPLLVFGIAAFAFVHWGSIAHSYLLADNRHYPFYLWRWVILRTSFSKYCLVPIYLVAWISIFIKLGEQQSRLWIFFYVCATMAVLIPSPLIEFRYFIIPFLLQALHTPIMARKSCATLTCTFVQYMLINIGTAYLFLFRPFSWAHEAGVQRFIW